MRKGFLNKAELRRIGRTYTDLRALADTLPPHGKRSREEESTGELLRRGINACAELLRWQDYSGVWREVSK